jgi:hypothetical protein
MQTENRGELQARKPPKLRKSKIWSQITATLPLKGHRMPQDNNFMPSNTVMNKTQPTRLKPNNSSLNMRCLNGDTGVAKNCLIIGNNFWEMLKEIYLQANANENEHRNPKKI